MSILKVGSIVNPADNVSLDITDIARSVLPTGTVIYLAGSTVPTGFLKCNGAELLRSVYTDLFSAIGDAYGAGDGTTTFKLPDLRGEFIRCWSDGRSVDTGRSLGSFQADLIKTIPDVWLWSGAESTSGFAGGGSYSGRGSTQSRPSSWPNGTETRPRNIALMAVIKY